MKQSDDRKEFDEWLDSRWNKRLALCVCPNEKAVRNFMWCAYVRGQSSGMNQITKIYERGKRDAGQD